ncbi:DNA polymerase II [Shewanella surugensis]|uniref:DNA polymerase n=1 Tax=Shewanella surugensis TaxID=212020 RepID=A0ABT0L992_9GAMM|nr:DNA polymerase II [Shewanella surugensis]MCL1123912.1 DNA polymerase II [Shewanella surugensis]
MSLMLAEPVSLKGRVLTRQAIQIRDELFLQYFIQTHTGAKQVLVKSEHVCFCQATDVERLLSLMGHRRVRAQAIPLSNFQFEPVSALYSSSFLYHRQLIRIAKDADIELYEADIKAENRFLMERFVALDVEFSGHEQTVAEQGDIFVANRARQAQIELAFKAISLDFECSPNGELYSVGLYGKTNDQHVYQKVLMVGSEQVESPEYIEWVKDEVMLIYRLISWFNEFDPDIIIGWSVVNFDLALLYKRAKHHNVALIIGREGSLLEWKIVDKYRPETLLLPGRVVLEGIDWLKAAFYQFERYSLDFVAHALLGEGKAIHQVDNRLDEIVSLFTHDKIALAHYNITDSRLVWDIFERTQLFDFAIERARLTGLELGRVGGSVAAFNHLYLPHLHRSGYVAPCMKDKGGRESPGGYVMNSIPGLYQHILVLDFKSLYPSIIRSFLIDPKGLIEGMKESKNKAVEGFLEASFSRDNPILPQIVATLAMQREKAKKEGNGPLSQAIKIIMNSLYGVLGSGGCVFNDPRLASSITLRGHEIMKQTRTWIQEYGYQVIYGDTDSTFVWLGDEVPDPQYDIDELGAQLARMITDKWSDKLRLEWQLDSFLELEYECHYQHFFMPTLRDSTEGSKKRYVGAIQRPDHSLNMVFKGMEQVRSDWSPIAKRVQYELYLRLFQGQDVVLFLRNTLNDLTSEMLNSELVLTKRLKRNIDDYKIKSAPHLDAARKLSLLSGNADYLRKGTRVEYVMTINGAEPAAFRQSRIDFDYYINKQLAPIAEPVLTILNKRFSEVASNQIMLI